MSARNLRGVLITGGAGFLGRHFANRLATEGRDVTVLDSLSSANASFSWPELHHPSIRLLEGSIFDAELVTALVRSHADVVHLASIVGVGETIDHPVETASNLVGTINLVKALTPDHVLVFGSSADVYGMHSMYHDGPMREEDHVVYEHALVNRWVYPKIKAVEENLVAASGARTVSVRIFNAYGAGMDYPHAKRVIPQFVRQIFEGKPLLVHGSGSQVRSFCYYTDMVEGFSRCLDYARDLPANGHETMNLGGDHAISMLELAKLLIRIAVAEGMLGSDLAIHTEQSNFYRQTFCDGWDRIPDLTRARDRLGFRTRVNLEEGLRRTLHGYSDLLHRTAPSF